MKDYLEKCYMAKPSLKRYLIDTFPGFYHSVNVVFDTKKNRWSLFIKCGKVKGRNIKSIYIPFRIANTPVLLDYDYK